MSELADRTWPEISGDDVLAIPVGSTEQHGPHLPFSTDTDVAVALARALAEQRPDVLVAPAMPYGSSGEHQAFAGTLSIGPSAIETVLVELGRSATETFGRILFVSGHGGNAIPVNRAVRRLRSEGRDALAWAPRWKGDAHAGRTETSVQLWLDDSRVSLQRAEPGNTAPLAELLPTMRQAGLRPVTPNGILGDPTGATAEEGAQLLAEAAADLATTVARWLDS
ncbi:mycofactocin biosynthesis peptidyl-dipeptidase MftE [Cryptosporangium phraense]|uniref:Mycofactocin biosynthesis peptidyl-dipeptidase MftE n=1 Tax=Cryptosporangium phraense TaxID=2593070 RepID=A0A545APH1_9ACTN|nr:mycofactocin biosynthesis peptidyl-dipeptidase MftE [Cryptosporangium phraense]TQS42635.1 mycofactocin biosynthesis peptidyl-dipeptidase MftE [Cryptosporangium phraense]